MNLRARIGAVVDQPKVLCLVVNAMQEAEHDAELKTFQAEVLKRLTAIEARLADK